jgi:hypothetical protein
MEKNQRELFWEALQARASQADKEVAEIRQLMKKAEEKSEADRKKREAERKKREAERKAEMKKMKAEMKADREKREAEREKMKENQQDFMKRMDRLDALFAQTREQIGGISKSNGEFCEEYFINSFKEKPTLFGERFDRVVEYLKPDPVVINDEYDLVLRNGSTIALIEMKYKANTNDVGKMFSKLHSYRANYPMFKDYKVYLCLASFRFPKLVRLKAAEEGIVLIEQRGGKIEVISENLKTW